MKKVKISFDDFEKAGLTLHDFMVSIFEDFTYKIHELSTHGISVLRYKKTIVHQSKIIKDKFEHKLTTKNIDAIFERVEEVKKKITLDEKITKAKENASKHTGEKAKNKKVVQM